MAGGLYDRIGTNYSATRRADPRLAAAIWEAIGDAATVVNVGAGTGAYEPTDRDVVAVEPSAVMIAQRHLGPAEVVQASAEGLPFANGTFDAAMVERGLNSLAADLRNGAWRERHRDLLELEQLHLGYYIVVAELAG